MRVRDGRREYLLVQHKAGHWSFPKGHPDDGETPHETARRELAEETGLDAVRLLEAPGFEESYRFRKRSGTEVIKSVLYFIGHAPEGKLRLQASEVSDGKWGSASKTAGRMTFDEGRALLSEIERFLEGGGGAPIGL